jgi:hypothetical protein
MLKPFDPARANAIFARIPTGGGVWTPIGEAIYDEREAVGEVENALSLGNPWLALKTADRVVDLTFRASLLVPIAARLAQRDLDLALDVVESIFIEEYRRKALTDVADVVLPRLPARGY